MDERVRRRIVAFYVAGIVNVFLGLYVLFEGRSVLAPGTWLILVIFFFGFAAVDFWFPHAIRKKWLEEQARLRAARDERGGMSDAR